jgi:hypothetical protein
MVPMSASDGGTNMPTWLDVLAFAQNAEELAFDWHARACSTDTRARARVS